MLYFKCDKVGLTRTCLSSPELFLSCVSRTTVYAELLFNVIINSSLEIHLSNASQNYSQSLFCGVY